jgi:SAM-dependent methyltransferase
MSAIRTEDYADYQKAQRRAPYADETTVASVTAAIVAAGHSIFHIHKLADNDSDHVAELLSLFAPPQHALVLDAGCGVGRVAELMADLRPDLRFILLNVSGAQLALCSVGFDKRQADFHDTGLPDGSVGAVMFNYSLGHGLLVSALAEAARVLAPGGILFIYDLTAEDSATLIESLGYKAHPAREVVATAREFGFALDFAEILTETSVSDFSEIAPPSICAELARIARPVAYRFVRRELGRPVITGAA